MSMNRYLVCYDQTTYYSIEGIIKCSGKQLLAYMVEYDFWTFVRCDDESVGRTTHKVVEGTDLKCYSYVDSGVVISTLSLQALTPEEIADAVRVIVGSDDPPLNRNRRDFWIQDLQTQITALEARVATLEGN